MKITTLDQSVRTVLGSSFFEIPRFQRPYAWEKDNVEEFWGDTLEKSSPADYFIGSIVLYPSGTKKAIVDGQQRITTILLVLCALRNRFAQESFSEQALGLHTLIERHDVTTNQKRFTLETETSYPYLQDRILRFGEPELDTRPLQEELTLQTAFELITGKIDDLCDSIALNSTLSEEKKQKQLFSELSRLRDKMLDLRLISVELDNEDDAYLIFETLNTRGKDLTVAQLAKNHFTRLLKAKGTVDPVSIKWRDIHEKVETSATLNSLKIFVDDFLVHYWISKYEYLSKKKLYRSLKSTITKANAKESLNDIVTNVDIYRTAFEPDRRKWTMDEKAIRRALSALPLFDVRQPAPLVLALLRLYFSKEISRKNAEAALQAIERFHFVHTAVSSKTSTGGMSTMYSALARRLTNAKDKNAAVPEVKRKLKERWPTLDEFQAGFLNLRSSEKYSKDKALARYILIGLDSHAREDNKVDYDQYTVEHIASQTPSHGGAVDDEHVAMVGNLCLVTKKLNEDQLGNKSTLLKAPILKKAGVPLLDELIANPSAWNASAIEARTKALAKFAYEQVWKAPG